MTNDGQVLISGVGLSGAVAAPGSGSTITIWQSSASGLTPVQTARIKRLIFSVYSSHASAASGLQFDGSYDGGTNWRNIVSYSISATTLTINYVSVAAPLLRVRYVNSASVLTTWEYSLMSDTNERASQ